VSGPSCFDLVAPLKSVPHYRFTCRSAGGFAAYSKENPMNTTDQQALAALNALAYDGVVAISARRLAEHIGRTRETASKSLGRLIRGRYVVRLSAGRGVQSARYRVLPKAGRRTCTKP
jgi:hypothetical protein